MMLGASTTVRSGKRISTCAGSPGAGDHRGQPGPDPGVLPDTAADGPGQHPVPGLGDARLRRLPRVVNGTSAPRRTSYRSRVQPTLIVQSPTRAITSTVPPRASTYPRTAP